MTSLADEGVGSAEARVTDANNARSVVAHCGSVRTARVTVTAHPSVSSRDLQYPHHRNVQWPKHSNINRISPGGAGSAYATTQVTRRSTAQRASCAAIVGSAETSISCVPTSVMTTKINSCTVKKRRGTPNFTETASVEVEPTSIQKGGQCYDPDTF